MHLESLLSELAIEREERTLRATWAFLRTNPPEVQAMLDKRTALQVLNPFLVSVNADDTRALIIQQAALKRTSVPCI